MILDSHHHLWRFDPARLPWISEAMPALRQDYGIADLEAALAGTGVDRTILVHAQQRIDETEWMLGLAAASARIAGVVGWVPLVAPDLEDTLSWLTADGRLRGVRHIVHDEPDDDYLLRDDVNRGVARLRRHGLVYDVLIFAKHLPQAIVFVDRHPEQPFVVDHVAKPTIRPGHFDTRWAEGLRAIAERPHVSCKLSGLVTEVRDKAGDSGWTPGLLQPYVDVALEAFGPSRLMFGTDWPVCRLQCEYADWVAAVRGFVNPLSSDEQAAIMGGTAARVYGVLCSKSSSSNLAASRCATWIRRVPPRARPSSASTASASAGPTCTPTPGGSRSSRIRACWATS